MATRWSGYDEWRRKADESGWYFSDEDLARAAYDPAFAGEIYGAKEDYARASTQSERDAAHGRAESARSAYDYSGGAAGDEYLRGSQSGVPTYLAQAQSAMNAANQAVQSYGAYDDPYEQRMNAQLGRVLDFEPFSYDYRTDPAWQAYKKEYTREGRRASEDALAQAAVMTGGVPSSYAQTAAQQAGNYYAAQMSDKIPELYRLAYEMYADRYNRELQGLNAVRGMSDLYYGRYGDQFNRDLSRLDAARAVYGDAYGAYQDQRDYADARGDLAYNRAWNEDERAYERQQAENARALSDAMDVYLKTGDDSMIRALGINPSTDALLQLALANGGRTVPVGSGGGGGGGGKPDLTVAQVNSAIKQGVLTDKVLEAYEYYYGEPYAPGDGEAADATEPKQLRLFMDALNSGISPANYIATHYADKEYGFDKASGLTSEYNKWVKEHTPTSPEEWEIGMPELLPGYTPPGFGAERLDNIAAAARSGGAGSGGMAGPSGLDYSPDEGVFTWNGKTFSSVSALAAAIDSADLSDAEKEKLSRALGAYGFDVSFG